MATEEEKRRRAVLATRGAVQRVFGAPGGQETEDTTSAEDAAFDEAIAAAAASTQFGSTGGRYRLPQDFRPKERRVSGYVPGMEPLPEELRARPLDPDAFPDVDPALRGRVTPGDDFFSYQLYAGRNLVGRDGTIQRQPYDLSSSSEVNNILAELDDTDRRELLNFLYAKGFYDTQDGPSATGFSSRDQQAVTKLLFVSNVQGLTWDMALDYVAGNPAFVNPSGARGGVSRQIPPEAELRMVMADATHRMLGRAPTREEVARYVDTFKSTSLSPTAAAEVAVERVAGPEEGAYGFAQMAQLMTRLLGG